MFKSAYAMTGTAERIAAAAVTAALLLGSLEYARLAALPAHFV